MHRARAVAFDTGRAFRDASSVHDRVRIGLAAISPALGFSSPRPPLRCRTRQTVRAEAPQAFRKPYLSATM